MQQSLTTKKFNTRKLVLIGMLSGISMFLGLSNIGFIPLPWMKVTIMHVPAIIGGIVEGPIVGAIVGLIFGLFSVYDNITRPVSLFSPFFMNPIISIVPRVLIGIVSYYIYRFIKNKFNKENIGIGIAAAAGTITNTVGVLGLVYIFTVNNLTIVKGIDPTTIGATLLTIVGTNCVPEIIVSILLVVPICLGLFRLYNRK